MLSQQHKPLFLKNSVLLPLAVLTTVLMMVIASQYYYHLAVHYYNSFTITDKTEVIKLADRLEVLNKHNFFSLSNRTKDVGEILNTKIQWSSHRSSFTGAFVDTKDIMQLNNNAFWKDENYKHFANNSKLGSLTFPWIDQINDYDYWNLFKASPQKTWGQLPVPDSNYLRAIVRLYLTQGLKTKNFDPYLRNVRHLAKLLWTQGIISSSMLALNILSDETHAFHKAQELGIVHSEWKSFDNDFIKVFRRLTWDFLKVFNVTQHPINYERLATNENNELFCLAGNEGIARYKSEFYLNHKLFKESEVYKNIKFFENNVIPEIVKKCRVNVADFEIEKQNTFLLSTLDTIPLMNKAISFSIFSSN